MIYPPTGASGPSLALRIEIWRATQAEARRDLKKMKRVEECEWKERVEKELEEMGEVRWGEEGVLTPLGLIL